MITLHALINALGLLAGVGLLGFGLWFYAMPEAALAGTGHLAERLPQVMAGRYAFFGAMLLAALAYGDGRVTGTLLSGFAAMGGFDAMLYWQSGPGLHLLAGGASLLGALYFFSIAKGAD